VIGDEQSEQVERRLVDALRRFTEAPSLDVVEYEIDVATVPNPVSVSGYSERMSS